MPDQNDRELMVAETIDTREREHCREVAESTPLGTATLNGDAVRSFAECLEQQRAGAFRDGKNDGYTQAAAEFRKQLFELVAKYSADLDVAYKRGWEGLSPPTLNAPTTVSQLPAGLVTQGPRVVRVPTAAEMSGILPEMPSEPGSNDADDDEEKEPCCGEFGTGSGMHGDECQGTTSS